MFQGKTFFILRAKILFSSWGLQILFALWIALLFVIFAKMDHVGARDRGALAFIFNDESSGGDAVRMPPPLFAPFDESAF